MPNKNPAGFTLIELLIVISVMGLLASLILVWMGSVRAQGRDAQRVAETDAMRKALEMYYDEHGDYPLANAWVKIEEDATLTSALKPWLPKTPSDPLYPKEDGSKIYSYQYQSTPDQQGYKIHVEMETGKFTTYQYEVVSGGGGGITYGGGAWVCGDAISYAGQNYNTVSIGSQCWFKENLNVGTMISDAIEQGYNCPSPPEIEKYCYDNSEANCASDGALYTAYQAMCNNFSGGVQGICPAGWHIPTHDEWTTLERAVCVSATCAADFPYDVTTTGWRGTNEGAALKSGGSSGFDAILAGNRYGGGGFGNRGSNAFLWSSTAVFWHRRVSVSQNDIQRVGSIGTFGESVRCLKD